MSLRAAKLQSLSATERRSVDREVHAVGCCRRDQGLHTADGTRNQAVVCRASHNPIPLLIPTITRVSQPLSGVIGHLWGTGCNARHFPGVAGNMRDQTGFGGIARQLAQVQYFLPFLEIRCQTGPARLGPDSRMRNAAASLHLAGGGGGRIEIWNSTPCTVENTG